MKNLFIYLLSISYICSTSMIHLQPIKFQSVFDKSVVIEEEHIIEKNENDIEITYPVILGLENSDKVNDLIKSHIYGIVENHKRTIYKSYDVLLFLEYEIGFINDRFLSICYKGWWGALGSGRGWPLRVYTINIDLEEEKLVSKSDMVENTSKIFDLLMEGEFEFSGGIEATPFDWDNLDRFEDKTLKYYIEEDRFCLTLSGTHSYGIYSIDIDRIKQYLNKDIVEKLYVYPMEDSVLSRDSPVIVDQYIIKREGNNVCVKYPMILGLDNAETVNSLIKTHISGIVNKRSYIIKNHYYYEMHYQYEVEFFNDKFLSIRYEGWWAAEEVGIRRTGRTHTINIDIEEGKVVSKADMVKDSDRVFEMLMDNQFESVELDGKEAKPYFSPGDFIRQTEGLTGSHLDYYIKGDKFIITRQETYDFTEYAIRISEIKEYLNEDMVRKLSGFPEKRDSVVGQEEDADPYVEEAKDLPERKEDTSISERGKNTVTRDANGRITIHITTKELDREHR